MDDVNDRHNFREDYYNISNTTVADGGERVVPIGKFWLVGWVMTTLNRLLSVIVTLSR